MLSHQGEYKESTVLNKDIIHIKNDNINTIIIIDIIIVYFTSCNYHNRNNNHNIHNQRG